MDIRALINEPSNLLLPIAAGVLTQAVRTSFRGIEHTAWAQRVLPLLPFVFSVGLAVLGVGTAGPLAERILLGILAGAVSGAAYKLFKTTVAGKGLAVEEPAPVQPPAAPVAPVVVAPSAAPPAVTVVTVQPSPVPSPVPPAPSPSTGTSSEPAAEGPSE